MCDKLDAELLAASQEAMESGSITPLVKKELWLKIQIRRLAEGKEELVVPPTPSLSYQITQAEQAKKRKRQEQNRRAAKRFRKKAKNKRQVLLERLEELEESNRQLEEDRVTLIQEKNQTLLQLCHHLQICQTCPGPSMQLPPLTPAPQDVLPVGDKQRKRGKESDDAVLTSPGTSFSNREAGDRFLAVVNASVDGGQDVQEGKSRANLDEGHGCLGPEGSQNALVALKRKRHHDQNHEEELLEGFEKIMPAGGSPSAQSNQLCLEDAVPSTSQHHADDKHSSEENHSATAVRKDVELMDNLKGFCQGVMFLQIVDGQVCLRNVNGQLGQLELGSKPPFSSSSTHISSPVVETAFPLTDLVSSPPKETSVVFDPSSCAQPQQKLESSEKKLLYRLDTSCGLPFFVMDNCLQNTKYDTELHESPQPIQGKEAVKERPRAKKERKITKAKRRTTKTANRKIRSTGKQKVHAVNSSRKTIPIYEDPADHGEHPGQDSCLTPTVPSRAVETSCALQQSKVTRSLRDETNVRLNTQCNLGTSVASKQHDSASHPAIDEEPFQSCPKKSNSNHRREVRESSSEHWDTTSREASLSKTNPHLSCRATPGPAQSEAAPRLTEEACLRGNHDARDFSSTRSQTSSTDAKATTSLHGRISPPKRVQPQTEDVSSPGQKTHLLHASCSKQPPVLDVSDSTSGAKYDPELQNFLAGCFESLDTKKTKADEEERQQSPTQGLVLLTSVELRCLATGTSQTCASTKLDLSNLDSLRLLKILKDCGSGSCSGRGSSAQQGGDQGQSEDSGKTGCFPMCLFSGLKSLFLDSENNMPTTSEEAVAPPPPCSASPLPLPPLPSPSLSSQSGYYLLPILLSGDHNLHLPGVDPASSVGNQALADPSHVGPAGDGSAPALDGTRRSAGDSGSGHSLAFPGPQSPVAGQAVASVSPSGAEYSRLVDSLIQSLASGHV